MKKNIIIAIFAFSFAFSQDSIFKRDFFGNETGLSLGQTRNDPKNSKNESSANEESNDEEDDNTVFSTKIKKKPDPVISLNNRQISISLENSKTMKIEAFSVNGKKLFKKQFSGGDVSFTIPKTAKNAIIVQIDSDGRFYSKKVAIN